MLFQPWQGSPAEKNKSDRGEFKDVCLYSTALQAQVFESAPAVGPVQVLAVNNASIPFRLCVLVSSLYRDPVKITCPGSPTRAFSTVSNGIVWAECKGEGAVINPTPTFSATRGMKSDGWSSHLWWLHGLLYLGVKAPGGHLSESISIKHFTLCSPTSALPSTFFYFLMHYCIICFLERDLDFCISKAWFFSLFWNTPQNFLCSLSKCQA